MLTYVRLSLWTNLGTDGFPGLNFSNTSATARDARLAELAEIKSHADRARKTLAYLRSLPPWPEPYTPGATPDGSPPKPIGGETLTAQAEALSDKTPLAEELVQDPETGSFSVRFKPIEKPDLLSATLGQVADALEDVLHDPSNGLNQGSLEIRKLRRTLDRYANDPQRVEMDFTTVHQSLTRQVANEELPPSETILGLMAHSKTPPRHSRDRPGSRRKPQDIARTKAAGNAKGGFGYATRRETHARGDHRGRPECADA